MKMLILLAYACFIGVVSLSNVGIDISGIQNEDKILHFTAYFIFALLAGTLSKSKRVLVALFIGIVAYSALIEYAQSFVPGRDTSIYDLLANSLGVAIGAGVTMWLATKLRKI